MTVADDPYRDWVGPVLQAGAVARAVIDALVQGNPGTKVIDRGAYIRVLSPYRCLLDKQSVETRLGEPFNLPGDLERIMPAFRGKLLFREDRAVWEPYGGAE